MGEKRVCCSCGHWLGESDLCKNCQVPYDPKWDDDTFRLPRWGHLTLEGPASLLPKLREAWDFCERLGLECLLKSYPQVSKLDNVTGDPFTVVLEGSESAESFLLRELEGLTVTFEECELP